MSAHDFSGLVGEKPTKHLTFTNPKKNLFATHGGKISHPQLFVALTHLSLEVRGSPLAGSCAAETDGWELHGAFVRDWGEIVTGVSRREFLGTLETLFKPTKALLTLLRQSTKKPNLTLRDTSPTRLLFEV